MAIAVNCNTSCHMVNHKMVKIKEALNITFYILLIILAGFIIYQIIRKILGGSWTTESIIVTLTITIIASFFVMAGFLINQAKTLGKIENELTNLKTSFCTLAKDFKQHLSYE